MFVNGSCALLLGSASGCFPLIFGLYHLPHPGCCRLDLCFFGIHPLTYLAVFSSVWHCVLLPTQRFIVSLLLLSNSLLKVELLRKAPASLPRRRRVVRKSSCKNSDYARVHCQSRTSGMSSPYSDT